MKKDIKLPSNRNFGIVFFIVFLLIALWPRLNENELRLWSLLLSLTFLLLGVINSKFLTPFNKLWFRFGILLGNFISPIVMGFVFFLVVTPTGLIMKLFGKDILRLKKNKTTYWINKDRDDSSMKNQF